MKAVPNAVIGKQPEQQVEDEEMVDAPSPPPPALADEDEPIDEPVSPVDDSDAPSARSTPARGQWSSAQKRRAGRPSKARAHDWDEADEAELPDAADTPKKRGGWRGRSVRGGRGGRTRGGPSHVTQVPMDKDGNILTVKDDEIQLPEDPEGETKIDQMGNLQGNRQYRVRVFTISGKGDRLYMLSTEPARCVNYRDSYLLFQKHPQLYKIILSEEAKRDLIARNIIPHSYKGRAIGVVTAHSIFREFGARVVVGGRKIVDDYQVAAARARGDVEGAIADVDDKLPTGNAAYDVNQYVAWHGASNVYHSGQPSAPRPNGKNADGKKRKAITNREEWMLVHAREAR